MRGGIRVLLPAVALLSGCEGARPPAPPQRQAAAVDADFRAVAAVLQSPRCGNCHAAGDRPLVGDEGRAHPMNVKRAADGRGTVAMRCSSCHPPSNAPGPNAPPGAPDWRLPPEATPMVFVGVGLAELCRSLKDPGANGGRDLAGLARHAREDRLVMWGWDPGEGRTPPPLSRPEFIRRFDAWIKDGAPCPRGT